MPTRVFRSLPKALALLCALVLAPAAFAQADAFRVVADIPFDFHVNGKLMPAGAYTVSPTLNYSIVIASQKSSGPVAAAITNPAGGGVATHDRSELVFQRYGTQYFLRQVWRAGLTTGRELPASKPERELMFHAAYQPERVYVAAR